MKAKPLPSQERLKELFDYSVITGKLYRKTSAGGAYVGDEAGWLNRNGYYYITIGRGNKYLTSRIIWCWVTGEDPGVLEIDHINGDPTNNSWHNLRAVTSSENKVNQKDKNGKHDLPRGVYHNKKGFGASIRSNGTRTHLGTYPTPELAHEAYCCAAEKLHGEFVRFK